MSPPLTSEQEKMLEETYQDNRFGRNRLIDALRLRYPKQNIPSFRQTLEWLKGQEDHQIHSRPTRPLTIAPIKQLTPGHVQADLFIMSSYIDRGFRSALVVVDIFTKFVAAEALRGEDEPQVTRAMTKILDRFPNKVTTCQTDPGSHFLAGFNVMLRRRGITHFYSQTARPQSNAVVERQNGSIKAALFKEMTARRNRAWAVYLPKVIGSINSVRSYTTGKSPDELVKASVEEQEVVADKVNKNLDRRYPRQLIDKPLEEGDYVRLRRVLTKYEKAGVKGYYSEDVYTITRVIISKKPQIIPTYIIADSDGNLVKGRQPRSNLLLIPKPDSEAEEEDEDEDEPGPAPPDDPRRQSLRKQGEYLVEYIFGKKGRGKSLRYHVKWVGYGLDQSTWEPLKNLVHAKEAIADFNKGG